MKKDTTKTDEIKEGEIKKKNLEKLNEDENMKEKNQKLSEKIINDIKKQEESFEKEGINIYKFMDEIQKISEDENYKYTFDILETINRNLKYRYSKKQNKKEQIQKKI